MSWNKALEMTLVNHFAVIILGIPMPLFGEVVCRKWLCADGRAVMYRAPSTLMQGVRALIVSGCALNEYPWAVSNLAVGRLHTVPSPTTVSAV